MPQGVGKIALLIVHDAEKMQRIGTIRLHLQRSFVAAARLIQPSRPMVRQRFHQLELRGVAHGGATAETIRPNTALPPSSRSTSSAISMSR